MKRREFITLLGGAAAWPLGAHAQQAERTRRIGVLMHLAADDPEAQARIGAFLQGLQEWGWAVGRNVRIEYRWAAGDAERIRKYAAELVALAPDVILATGGAVVGPLLEATSTVPIVFAQTPDQSGPASSRPWRGRAAMPPVLQSSNTASVGNGSSCSRRSRRE
jgi:putative tryptophan/tyrosine transport system substrate-binding protein